MRKLVVKGASVSLVLHDINLASRFSDELTLLKNGRILAKGSPGEVITRENMKEAFSVEVEVHDFSCHPTIQANTIVTD